MTATSVATSEPTGQTGVETYYGNCHCGALKFHVKMPSWETLHLKDCLCSICAKKGYRLVFPKLSDIVVEKGAGNDGMGGGVLKDYDFGSKQLWHRFCGVCGNSFCWIRKNNPEVCGLNTRLLRGVDLWSMRVEEDLGPVTPLRYEVPVFAEHKVLETKLDDGEKIYDGSCHCGAIKFGVRTKPLDHDDAFPIKECDCSCCLRYGVIYTYPTPADRVHIQVDPPSALTTYMYPLGKKFSGTQFCSICGIQCFNHLWGPPPEVVARQTDQVKEMIKKNCDIKPVNVRTLNFFLGLSQEDKGEWQRIKKRLVMERGSQDGQPYKIPE